MSAGFVKSEKRRPKTTKRKKLGDQDVCGGNTVVVRETGIKSEAVLSGVKNEADLPENWPTWQQQQQPRNGHIDIAAVDVKPNQDELNTMSNASGNDSTTTALPSMTSSVSELMNEQVVGANNRPGPPGVLGPPTCVLPPGPPPRIPLPAANRGFGHRPPMAGLDSHFVPQQSQIFVFCTNLANDAAEAVQSGRCRSIVDFHLDQPATKQFLQTFPTDAPLFPGSQAPPYNDGNKLLQRDPMPYMESESALANVELWVQQQNASLQEGPFSPSFGPPGKQSRSKGSGSGSQLRWMPSPNRGPMVSSLGEFMGPGGEPMLGPPGYMGDGPIPRGGGGMPPGQGLDENLTPEQLQRREEQLAQLQKIKNLLFPEKRNDFDPRRQQGMFPGAPRPGPEMMGFSRFPHPGMMPMQHHGMMEPPDGLMGMPMDPGFFGQPALPPNWESMTPEERDWFKMQHEFYLEREKSQMQMVGPGPGFFNDLPPRMAGPMSPMSPSFNGSGPLNHQGFFYQGPPGMNFPPNGHGPEFHPDFMPGMGEGVFPFDNGGPGRSSQPGHDPGPVGMGTFAPGTRFPSVCKQKRRRQMGEKADDIYRHLQPAPSPQQFCSLNLFEGQELTITRQLNLAYQEPSYPSPSQSTPTQPRKKKKGGDPGKQKPDEQRPNKSSTPELFSSTSSLLSPLPQTNVSTPNTNTTTPKLTLSPAPQEQGPGTLGLNNMPPALSVSTGAGASTSLDCKCQPQADQFGSSASSSTPSTLSTNSSISRNPSILNNITSATLASLAKGVESLSDRMQLDMKQGGPFRTVQMPENELELSGDSSSGGNLVSLPGSGACIKMESTGNKTPQLSLDGCMPPSRGSNERSSAANPDVNCAEGTPGNVNEEGKERLVSDGPGLSGDGPDSKPSPRAGSIPPCNLKHSSPPSIQNITPVTSMLSPNIIGNANIQIEARAPNTIQYLPAVSCGLGPEGPDDPAGSCVTMPFDSAQLMQDGAMQPGSGPSSISGSGTNFGGPVHGYDGGLPAGPMGMMHRYDGPLHGPSGPIPGYEGHILVRNGMMPGFDVPHGQGGFGPAFDGPGGPGQLPPYSDVPMHGPGGPMSGFDGPMPNQVGPGPGFSGSGGPMPGFNGPPMHGPVCSMPGFEGQCGPLPEFDMPVHGHGGPPMPGYNGPIPGFGSSFPRHGGPLHGHCGGPMPGCHGVPHGMNMPPGQQMFLPGRGGHVLTAPDHGMPGSAEVPRAKPESGGTTRKEKDRKKRSETAKKNAAAAAAAAGANFMEMTSRDGRRLNPEVMGPGGGRMRAGAGMLRMSHADGGIGHGFMGMEGRIRPGMMLMEGGMRPGMMDIGPPNDGGVRPGMMRMIPVEGGMGPGMMIPEEAAMRSGMMVMDCEGGMRPGMMGMGPVEGGMRPGMMPMGPMDGGGRHGMIRVGPMEGRPGMMEFGPMEGGMRADMMQMQPGNGGMMPEHGMVVMGAREPGINVGPPDPGMNPSSRIMNMGPNGESLVQSGSNVMVMSPGGHSLRPPSGALGSADSRSRQGSAPAYSADSGGRAVDGNMVVPSPRMEDGRSDMMMMMGENQKRMVPSVGPPEVGLRPGSGLMIPMDHGDPSNMRPGSRPLSDRMMMGMGGEGGIHPGSAVMMGMVDGGVRPGSALMMGMGHGGDSGGGMRPGSAMMMGPGENGMRPGSAVMIGPDGMRLGPGMIPGGMCPGENGMRPNVEMMGMGPVPMRPGSGMMPGVCGLGDDPMRGMMPEMGPAGGDGRLRLNPDMVGGPRRIVDMGFCNPRLGPDGNGGGGGGMMAVQHRGGRMDPGMQMMDMRNGGMFPGSSPMGPDHLNRRLPGLEGERFNLGGEEAFNAQFQQFQQQLYDKGAGQLHPSPTLEMRGLPTGNLGYEMMRSGPNFGQHGGGVIHGGPPMGMGR